MQEASRRITSWMDHRTIPRNRSAIVQLNTKITAINHLQKQYLLMNIRHIKYNICTVVPTSNSTAAFLVGNSRGANSDKTMMSQKVR